MGRTQAIARKRVKIFSMGALRAPSVFQLS
jgi:hypothetical protein